MKTLERRQHIVSILQEFGPLPKSAIEERLCQFCARSHIAPPSERTIEDDLKQLRKELGDDVLRRLPRSQLEDVPKGYEGSRIFWDFAGDIEVLTVDAHFGSMSEDEVLALECARDLLAPVDGEDNDPLHEAMERLMQRLGIASSKNRTPLVAVNRQHKERYNTLHMREMMRAIRTGRSISMDYASAKGLARKVIAHPLRMVLSENEWFCFAWEQANKQAKLFKIARIRQVELIAPLSQIPSDVYAVEQHLNSGFRNATGQRRERVVLRFSRQAWPHIRDRSWGDKQRVRFIDDGHGKDPEQVSTAFHYGSPVWELSFTTEGISAVLHWALQFGGHIEVIKPEWLKRSLAEQSGMLYLNHRDIDEDHFPAIEAHLTLANPPRGLTAEKILEFDE